MTAFDDFIERLDRVREIASTNHVRRVVASCPTSSHQRGDVNPSLVVSETSDGTVLLHCYSQCTAHDICDSVGVPLRDLFPNHKGVDRTRLTEKPRIAHRDLLLLIHHEVHVIWIAAEGIERFYAKSIPVNSYGESPQVDIERVRIGMQRIRTAYAMAGVRLQ